MSRRKDLCVKTGSQERKLYPGKSYSFERDAFQVVSFYAQKGCDIIDF